MKTKLVLLVALLGASAPLALATDFAFRQKLSATTPTPGSQWGSVAVDGDTLAIGAFADTVGTNNGQGAVYVYVRRGVSWIFQQKLTAADGASNDRFGRAIGMSGNSIVVGASGDTFGSSGAGQGSAYVFVRRGTVWREQDKLTASDAGGGDTFGEYVRIDKNTVIVGARLSDRTTPTTQIDAGAAYVFVRRGTRWVQQAKLMASDGIGGDNFGMSADIDGDTAVVGAWFDTEGFNSQQGSAYIFSRTRAGIWTQQAKLLAPDGSAGDWFGIAVGISGDTLAIGARQDNQNAGTPGSGAGQGSAYLYTGSGAAWTLQQRIVAADPAIGAAFGESIAIENDRVLVGAVFDLGSGSAYLFSRAAGVWTQEQKLFPADRASGDFFADFVALSGPTIVAGAFGDDFPAATSQGSAYVFNSAELFATDLDLGGGLLEQGKSVVATGGDDRIVNHAAFDFAIAGTVTGTGALSFIPAGTTLGAALDMIEPGFSAKLEGTAINAKGRLPLVLLDETIRGSFAAAPAQVATQAKFKLGLKANGEAYFSLTGVRLRATGGTIPAETKLTFAPGTTAAVSVPPASAFARQPDLLLGIGSEPTLGSDVYNATGLDQTLARTVRRGATVKFNLLLQNDGLDADGFTVQGSSGDANAEVKYFLGRREITAEVAAGTFTTGDLASRESVLISVTAKAKISGTTFETNLVATSTTSAVAKDTAKLSLTIQP